LENYKMSMRDQISQVARSLRYSSNNADQLADAILAALPDMIAPLVWNYPFKRVSGEMLAPVFVSGLYYSVAPVEGKWKLKIRASHLVFGMGLYGSIEAAQTAADTHHRAAITAAFTGETQ
jgi:hypothetical protein